MNFSLTIRNIFLFVFGNLIQPILKIIRLFFKFQFCHIHSIRIGHLILDYDIALLLKKEDTLLLCSHSKKVANKFIANFLKNQKNVLFFNFFKFIYHSIHFINPNSNLIISWEQYHPQFHLYFSQKSKIELPYYSQSKINEILIKYKIKKNFVGLYARNNLYLKKIVPEDKNFHDYHDFNFEDYKLSVEYLDNKDNSIIKLGKHFPEENLNCFKTKIINSDDFQSNEEIDYFLNVFSRFNVFTCSGICAMSILARKKVVYVNYIPLNLIQLSWCSPGSLILPKKILNKETGKFLTFKESNELNLHAMYQTNPYENKNLAYVNNSPKEILETITEMDEILIEKNNSDAIKLNNQFWESLTDKNHEKIDYLKNVLKLSISTQFLKNNQNLF